LRRAQAGESQRGDSKLLARKARSRAQARRNRVKLLHGAPATRDRASDSQPLSKDRGEHKLQRCIKVTRSPEPARVQSRAQTRRTRAKLLNGAPATRNRASDSSLYREVEESVSCRDVARRLEALRPARLQSRAQARHTLGKCLKRSASQERNLRATPAPIERWGRAQTGEIQRGDSKLAARKVAE